MTSGLSDGRQLGLGPDVAPLVLAAGGDAALCTLVGIEGGFSRGLGAQFAVSRDGQRAGDMTGGCLDAALARECEAARSARARRLVRYGMGSPYIDIRLPCGGGLDILIDPFPDPTICAVALPQLCSGSRSPPPHIWNRDVDESISGEFGREWQAIAV